MKKPLLLFSAAVVIHAGGYAQQFPDEMHMSTDGHMLLIGDLPNTGLYAQDTIRNIYLSFGQPNYWNLLDSLYWTWTDAEIPATMVVDNTTYDSVGVRFRGQSSFQHIPSQDKKPFGISLDFVHPHQDIMGRKTLNLNNCYGDPSFIREIFYQHCLKRHLPVAKSSYARLFLNGQYWGLYLSVQQLNKSYYKDWFLSAKGTSWRADRISGQVTPYGDGTGGLNWLGPDTTDYQGEYILKFTDKTNPWDDLVNTCDILNNTPLSNLPSVLPSVMDVDRTLWFLASEILFSDDDSYVQKGRMDYYVYWEKETGRIVPQEYDGNTVMNPAYVNWSPFYHQDSVNYPLMNRLFAIPEYRQRYLAHLRTLITDNFTQAHADSLIDAYKAFIDTIVNNDPKKLYTYADFQNEVPVLKSFIANRRNFLYANAEVAETGPAISGTAWYVANTAWYPPAINQQVSVRTQVTCASGIDKVYLYYSLDQVGNFSKVQMFDDGMHDDGAAQDGVYGAALAGQPWGTWVRFYIEAVANTNSKTVTYDPAGAEHNVYAYQIGGVGVGELEEGSAGLWIFPNPASDHVEFISNSMAEQELEIVNTLGQQVRLVKFTDRTTVNVADLPEGLYIVKCGKRNRKLVVRR
jgi:hypothetical protein